MRSRLVPRSGAGDPADRLHERLGGQAKDRRVAGLGEPREVVGGERAQVEPRWPRHQLDVLLARAVLERQLVLRKRANDVEQQAAGQDGGALTLDVRVDANADAELHVSGLKL